MRGVAQMTDKDSYVPDASFSSLVLTLSSSAWVGLGKIADPLSGEIKKDMRAAKFTIDTLIMLRDKTGGNLSDDESKLLQAVLGDLQGNYAEAVFAGEDQKPAAAPHEASGEAPAEEKAAESGDSAGKETGSNEKGDSEASKENKEKEEPKEESKEE